MVASGILWCSLIQASSLTPKMAALKIAQISIKQINLEAHPIHVTLYTNGAALAKVTLGNNVYSVERPDYGGIVFSRDFTCTQNLTLCCAIESAFKKAKFRLDKKKVQSTDYTTHSRWLVQGNIVTKKRYSIKSA